MKTMRNFQVMDMSLQVPVADTCFGLFTDLFSNGILYLPSIFPVLSRFVYIFVMWDLVVEWTIYLSIN
jgi:hypothetical protein